MQKLDNKSNKQGCQTLDSWSTHFA